MALINAGFGGGYEAELINQTRQQLQTQELKQEAAEEEIKEAQESEENQDDYTQIFFEEKETKTSYEKMNETYTYQGLSFNGLF